MVYRKGVESRQKREMREMPWDERTVSQMREEFIMRILAQEKSKSALCREYGISRPTGDKWIARYLAGKPLEDQSRKPQKISGKTPAEMERTIVELRKAHPAIGAAKIRKMLEKRG